MPCAGVSCERRAAARALADFARGVAIVRLERSVHRANRGISSATICNSPEHPHGHGAGRPDRLRRVSSGARRDAQRVRRLLRGHARPRHVRATVFARRRRRLDARAALRASAPRAARRPAFQVGVRRFDGRTATTRARLRPRHRERLRSPAALSRATGHGFPRRAPRFRGAGAREKSEEIDP